MLLKHDSDGISLMPTLILKHYNMNREEVRELYLNDPQFQKELQSFPESEREAYLESFLPIK